MAIKVGVVGYGTIGKRVADAVRLQKDMKLVGVTAHSFNYRMLSAYELKIPMYTIDAENDLKSHGISPEGTFNDMLEETDVIID